MFINYLFQNTQQIFGFIWNIGIRVTYATFFNFFIYNQYSSLIYMLHHFQQKLSATETFLQKQSLTNTQVSHFYNPNIQIKLTERNSQQTLPQSLPFHSRSFQFDEPDLPHRMEEQIEELQERYKGIHKLLIKHSGYESDLHECKRGYRVMEIDSSALSKDFGNKLQIIEDIKSLVANMGNKTQFELDQLLETKFQQYYLQRHYGGLTCQVDSLSIQQRVDSSLENNQDGKELKDGKSKIGNYSSLIPQSKITYSQEFCQTQEISYDIFVEIPKIIEVQIPIIVYKLRERTGKDSDSEMINSNLSNIDDIINKFSKPYEELYSNRKESQPENTIVQTPQTLSPPYPPSVLLNSNVSQHITEIQLAYSDFPEEDKFKLPLDSYAQIQSFISNDSHSASSRSRPPTERQTPVSNETIFITQKGVGRSIIEKFQQTQRALLQENGQLKDVIQNLKLEIKDYQKRQKQLQSQNKKLSNRLQEQIQQSEYFAGKLDGLNAELLEQKIQCLTHLNDSKDRKIQMLNTEMNINSNLIEELTKNIEQLDDRLKKQEDLVNQREGEIVNLNKLLALKEKELTQLTTCEEDVLQVASQTQLHLRQEIQILEKEKSELKQNIKQYLKRLQNDGISLQYDEASQIQGIIQTQEHHFNLQLKEVNQKYDKILNAYQQQLNDLHLQIIDLKNKNEQKSQLIKGQHQQAMCKKKRQEHCKKFQAIVQEYNTELEIKDEEIMNLKRECEEHERKKQEFQVLQSKIHEVIVFLQNQLVAEKEEKNNLALQLVEMGNFLNAQMQQEKAQKQQLDAELNLIEQLTQQLQHKFNENQQLKSKVKQQQQRINTINQTQRNELTMVVQEQNKKLKKINSKLKRYTVSLEQQIRAVCGVDECESHKNWADQIIQQRNYYLQLALQECKYCS